MPKWMWEMLTIDNENSKQSTEDGAQSSPAQIHQHHSPNGRTTTQTLPVQVPPKQGTELNPCRMQQQIKMRSKRAYHLQMERKKLKRITRWNLLPPKENMIQWLS